MKGVFAKSSRKFMTWVRKIFSRSLDSSLFLTHHSNLKANTYYEQINSMSLKITQIS